MSVVDDLSTTARSVLANLGGAVVSIGQDGRGSGLVIASGKVLTNAHNLRDRTTLVIFADGRAEQGSVTGSDEDGDLVVLEVDTGSVTPATWAEQLPGAGDVVFNPTTCPSASATGPPDEPRTSGAVCSTPPCTCRPRGPSNARSTADTIPNEMRGR